MCYARSAHEFAVLASGKLRLCLTNRCRAVSHNGLGAGLVGRCQPLRYIHDERFRIQSSTDPFTSRTCNDAPSAKGRWANGGSGPASSRNT